MKLHIYEFKKVYKVMFSMLILAIGLCSCKKLVDVNPPTTSVTVASVFNSDATAAAVLTGLYSQISSTHYQLSQGIPNISMWAGLSSDEFTLWTGGNINQFAYFNNTLSSSTGGYEFWNTVYPYIFSCNSAIEGLNSSRNLTPAVKLQLLGEAKFMRAFFYFYLVNLYGDVPLVLGTNYTVNASISRSSKTVVYQQIITDLTDAKGLLSNNYLDGTVLKTTTERVRPSQGVAIALLARAYLYTGDYLNADAQATLLISNSQYNLSSLNNAFLKNSSEAIWQLQPVTNGTITNTAEAVAFIIPSTGLSDDYPVYLSSSLVNSFETGDNRKSNWINSVSVSGTTYYYPFKYKDNTSGIGITPTEYTMIFRLGEQYLIRAEARARLGSNLLGATSDLNAIRTRAGLANTTATTQATLIAAIMHERQVELFTELGHRWFDLKRTSTVDAVMSIAAIAKGGTWNTNQQLYPLPLSDIQKDANLIQNPGY